MTWRPPPTSIASQVCRKWKEGVQHALKFRIKLSFSGLRVDDDCVAGLVEGAYSLRELDISTSRWGCHITDAGLKRISLAMCCPNLTSISLWGVTAITDAGVVDLVSKATSLQHLNIGGTFITDISIIAISKCCQRLKILNLWGCRHVTGNGLLALTNGCPNLLSINVWGLRIPLDSYSCLLSINPRLHLKIGSVQLGPHWQAVH
ncbi:hypothetical protein KP509_21G064500 [Ceratopteris richardii]|uniref:F-box/LRR-repeat protein 15-like leucin rich repeat domain-containing protein n=1 Tax=Ceratopteris richardii TaxID=49495 RepID=A0A8T2SE21_CERRI|nr:hypothetical protein KP509_21G064500 [Ceratopteris richardii]